MGLFLFLLLSIFALTESQPHPPSNYSDLQLAMADMRSRSYYGFVILLQMLERPDFELGHDITFFMPSDIELSESNITTDNLQEFLLSHSIPTPLFYYNMLHFPTGTLVPSSFPNKMIRILNHGRSSFYLNNAQIVAPNICWNSVIKCHGINAVISYSNGIVPALPQRLPSPVLSLVPPPMGTTLGAPSPMAWSPEIAFPPMLSGFSQTGSGGLGSGVGFGFVLIFLFTNFGLLMF